MTLVRHFHARRLGEKHGRHVVVSWNLTIRRNPLLVAKEHGHRVITGLTVYTARAGKPRRLPW